jgi:hypothetical protein
MTAGPGSRDTFKRLRWIFAAAMASVAAGVLVVLGAHGPARVTGPTVGEKLAAFQADRAGLQARADGAARIGLPAAFRVASLLSDALALRHDADRERAFAALPAARQGDFAEVEALNGALRDAVDRPGEGARLAARTAAERARAALQRLAGADELPLVSSITPRFVAPRQATGQLTLTPSPPEALPHEGALRLDTGAKRTGEPTEPTVPRYAPAFAAQREEDPPVDVEIAGLHLASDGMPAPVLTVGGWRGEATVTTPQRLRFAVPRSAFATHAARAIFVTGTLLIRRSLRSAAFDLLFVVLPDRPGAFALDQKVRTTVPESNTLVSPEILARAGVGETARVRRCFDPPPGWRFDKQRRGVVVVERLGWQDDIGDPTLNGGTVEFAPDEGASHICVVVTAKPVSKTARTATIGRFEATLVRERVEEHVVQSGIRALDWREAARVPIEPGAVEWKLYVRLFDEIDSEFSGATDGGAVPAGVPFLRVRRDDDGRIMVLQADPAAQP